MIGKSMLRQVKYSKSASKEEKQRFIEELLATSDFSGEYFNRIVVDKHTD